MILSHTGIYASLKLDKPTAPAQHLAMSMTNARAKATDMGTTTTMGAATVIETIFSGTTATTTTIATAMATTTTVAMGCG